MRHKWFRTEGQKSIVNSSGGKKIYRLPKIEMDRLLFYRSPSILNYNNTHKLKLVGSMERMVENSDKIALNFSTIQGRMAEICSHEDLGSH